MIEPNLFDEEIFQQILERPMPAKIRAELEASAKLFKAAQTGDLAAIIELEQKLEIKPGHWPNKKLPAHARSRGNRV